MVDPVGKFVSVLEGIQQEILECRGTGLTSEEYGIMQQAIRDAKIVHSIELSTHTSLDNRKIEMNIDGYRFVYDPVIYHDARETYEEWRDVEELLKPDDMTDEEAYHEMTQIILRFLDEENSDSTNDPLYYEIMIAACQRAQRALNFKIQHEPEIETEQEDESE